MQGAVQAAVLGPPFFFFGTHLLALRELRERASHTSYALLSWRDALKCEGRNEGRLTLAGNIPPTRTRTGRGPPTRGSQSSRQTGVGRRPQVAALCPPSRKGTWAFECSSTREVCELFLCA